MKFGVNFNRIRGAALAALVLGLCSPLQGRAEPGTAVITFSGLFESVSSLDHDLVRSSYQPLLRPLLDPEHFDGANLGVTVFWSEALGANCRHRSEVIDHTGDADVTGDNPGGAVLSANHAFSISFDRPVEIPSFFWAFSAGPGGALEATFSVYKNASDSAPLKTISLIYDTPNKYEWKEAGFAGVQISKIVFEPRTKASLNIDDIKVRVTEGAPPSK